MRIIIVGGGIGGLAAAIALRKAGHEPVVLEQAVQMSPVGAGIYVTANGMKALTYLGVDGHVRRTSVNSQGLFIFDLKSDASLGVVEFGSAGEERYGDGCYLTYRPDLFDALSNALGAGDLRLGCKVQSVEIGEHDVRAILENGEFVEGDALIAADGLNSAIRTQKVDAVEAQFTGYTGWRTVLNQDQAPGLFPLQAKGRTWIGPRRTIVTYPMHNGELLNILCYVPVEVAGPESWTARGDPDVLRDAFRDACQPVRDILAFVDGALLTPLYFRRPSPSWGTGRITLLGDAAHAALTASAQGSSMALEDAVMLGSMIERFASEGIERAFREYEMRRIPRTTKNVAFSLSNLLQFTESDPDVIRAGYQALSSVAKVDPLNERTWGWLFHYDVRKAARVPTPNGAHGILYPTQKETEQFLESWLAV